MIVNMRFINNGPGLLHSALCTPFRSQERALSEFWSDESYHQLLCNFLHGSLTKNSGLPNIKYIQKLDNSNFLLSAQSVGLCGVFPRLGAAWARQSLVSTQNLYCGKRNKNNRSQTILSWVWKQVRELLLLVYPCFSGLHNTVNYFSRQLFAVTRFKMWASFQINPHSANSGIFESEMSVL